jgi:hypothetical protein
VFDGVHMVQTGCFEKFHEMVFQLPHLVLEVLLSDRDILLVKDVCFLALVIAASSNYDPPGALFCPFSLPLVPFLAPLSKALDSAAQLLSGTIFPSLRTRTAPTTSSPKACR